MDAFTDSPRLRIPLSPIDFAGRLPLATGKPISPEAVVGYCIAWRAATETLAGLVKKYGKSGLPKMDRKAARSAPCGYAERTPAL